MANESYVCVHKSLYITKKKEKQTNDSQLKEYTKEKYLLWKKEEFRLPNKYRNFLI